MPRKLPWLTDAATSKATRPPAKRGRLSAEEDDEPATPASRDRERDRTDGRDRALSSSPVAPASPRREEYMRDGLGADDIWRMVEDEFLDTAKLFTQHLHRAEYARLKSLANKQNKARADEIIRPVVGGAKQTPGLKLRIVADAKNRDQEEAIAKLKIALHQQEQAMDSSDDDEPAWMRDPHLARLMRKEPNESRNLAATVGIKSNTRASAGYAEAKKAPQDRGRGNRGSRQDAARSGLDGLAQELGLVAKVEISEDSDDLDAVVRSTPAPPASSNAPAQPPSHRVHEKQPTRTDIHSRSHVLSKPSTASAPRPSLTSSRPMAPSKDRGPALANLTRATSSASGVATSKSASKTTSTADSVLSPESARERILKSRAAKAEREKEDDKSKKKISTKEIPFFL